MTTEQIFDMGCNFDDKVRDKATGAEGRVASFSWNRKGNRGVWIEGLDSTGRPFEAYIEYFDIELVN